MDLKYYKVEVKHDNGVANIYVCAETDVAASKLVQAAEGCPLCAIKSVKSVSKKGF